jgi:hypothetical protein
MTRRHGLWLTFREGHEADSIERAIQENGTFTVAVPSAVKPRIAEVAVVSMTGRSADYLGIARAGARIATGQKRVAIVHLIDLRDLPINDLRAALPKSFSTRDFCGDRVTRPSPRLWEELLQAISETRSDVASQLPRLRKLVFELERGSLRREGGLEVFERDAVASSIQIFGGTKLRKRVLQSAEPADDDHPASFLARLKHVSLREDPQVIHDAATFPGMDLAKRYVVGAVQLENERGERLTILNCNRQPLERTLGVDLVYYAHSYDSFVMVQYKRMTKQSRDVMAYRPSMDKNYDQELTRMAEVEKMLAANSAGSCERLSDFRLSAQPLFFKLCESKAKAALDEGMVSGMYVPLPLWQQFMNSVDAQGKRGGVSIGWDNAPRHFSNSEFTSLLRRGWIGSSGLQSKLLSEIIEAVLSSDHMLVLAATSSASSGRDYLRDSFGRFTEEDDPLATR